MNISNYSTEYPSLTPAVLPISHSFLFSSVNQPSRSLALLSNIYETPLELNSATETVNLPQHNMLVTEPDNPKPETPLTPLSITTTPLPLILLLTLPCPNPKRTTPRSMHNGTRPD